MLSTGKSISVSVAVALRACVRSCVRARRATGSPGLSRKNEILWVAGRPAGLARPGPAPRMLIFFFFFSKPDRFRILN